VVYLSVTPAKHIDDTCRHLPSELCARWAAWCAWKWCSAWSTFCHRHFGPCFHRVDNQHPGASPQSTQPQEQPLLSDTRWPSVCARACVLVGMRVCVCGFRQYSLQCPTPADPCFGGCYAPVGRMHMNQAPKLPGKTVWAETSPSVGMYLKMIRVR